MGAGELLFLPRRNKGQGRAVSALAGQWGKHVSGERKPDHSRASHTHPPSPDGRQRPAQESGLPEMIRAKVAMQGAVMPLLSI